MKALGVRGDLPDGAFDIFEKPITQPSTALIVVVSKRGGEIPLEEAMENGFQLATDLRCA